MPAGKTCWYEVPRPLYGYLGKSKTREVVSLTIFVPELRGETERHRESKGTPYFVERVRVSNQAQAAWDCAANIQIVTAMGNSYFGVCFRARSAHFALTGAGPTNLALQSRRCRAWWFDPKVAAAQDVWATRSGAGSLPSVTLAGSNNVVAAVDTWLLEPQAR